MKILLVEDEIKLANAIQRALKLQKYAVDISYDGEAGLDMAIADEFDLIILDVMLPKINGIEICRKIRKERIHTPILLLTAKGQTEDKVLGLDAGADDYVVKPFSFEELFARARALTRRPTKTNEIIFQVKDLILNPVTQKVKRDNVQIYLSTKEFAILKYLMRNKNSVLSKERIVEHVWNYESNILPSTVEVHMKHLREKVDIPFKTQLIHTVRGFGYEIRDIA